MYQLVLAKLFKLVNFNFTKKNGYYKHQIGIKKSVSGVYQAVTSLEVISNWWTLAKGSCQVGEILELHFGDNEDFVVKIKVLQSVENKYLETGKGIHIQII